MNGGSILGHPVKRSEDRGMITGETRYLDDIQVEGALHAVFVRSIVAHAHVNALAADEAVSMPGVVGVFTAGDLNLPPMMSSRVAEYFARPILAASKVRFVGEPLAVVVAESRDQAVDAAAAVFVDYDFLDAVTDPELAMERGAPLLFPEHGSNVAVDDDRGSHPVNFHGADVVVSARFRNQRLAPVPMETNGCIAVPDGESGDLTVWLPVQAPFWARRDLAPFLEMRKEQIRVIAPAIGGGFGAKIPLYPEHVAIASIAVRLGRPVRFVESRSESMVAMFQGRGQVQRIELGATRDGRITALRIDVIAEAGAYPGDSSELHELTHEMASGVYDIPAIEFRARYVATNTTPTFAYRGAGRPEAAALIERAIDILARRLGIDPLEIRRHNFIAPDRFPHRTATGTTYDVGEYERALDTAAGMAGYDELRSEQKRRRSAGARRQLGIGVSTYVEITGFDPEFASVEMAEAGTVTVRSGLTPTGQGHETALAQLVAGTLGVPFEAVRVVHSDTARVARGNGTMGSRSLQIGGSAALNATRVLLEKAKLIAADLLEASPEDVVVADGGLGIAGAPETAVPWSKLASVAADPGRRPEDFDDDGLFGSANFKMASSTFPFGAHIAVIEVDIETGAARLVRHIAVDDCGTVLNPMLVEGQVHGGVAQGVAQALYEEMIYDEIGNPLTGSLMNYGMPTPVELPHFETARTQTPTPLNPLGAKGIGESGTIGSTPAVQNAVIDAVSHLGIEHIDMPLTPVRVWEALQSVSPSAQ